MSTEPKKILLQSTSNPSIKKGYVDAPDGQLHYWTAGRGPALLLVHQSSSSAEEYAAMVPFLAEHFYLIAYDWPGHGNSDDPPKEYGVDDYANSALVVLDHLNVLNCHVVGHHGGALVAMNLAWRYPKRMNKLILSGTSGIKEESETKEFLKNLEATKGPELAHDGEVMFAAWKRYVNYLPDSKPKEILIPFINNMVARLRPYDAHHGVLGWDRRPALKSFTDRKILLTQGDQDVFVSHQENLLAILPLAERVVIPNAGAFHFFEKPKTCAEVIAAYLLKE